MKKVFTLLTLCIAVSSSAQITITQSNLPQAGWGYINAVDTNYNTAITAGGAAQSWNYANLLNVTQDSILFINAAGTPYAAQFPGANLSAYDPQTGAYAYFTTSASGFYLNGGAGPGFPVTLIYNPAQMFIPVPFTYNSTYSGYSRFQVDTVVQGVNSRFVQYTSINILGDGYGSLTIPTGNHPNTIRTKTTLLQIDSVYINVGFGWVPAPGFNPPQTQTTDYKWLRTGNGTLLLEIEADSLGQTGTQSSYQLLFGILGIDENSNVSNLSPYPNPSSHYVSFQFENYMEDAILRLYNMAGQEIESHDVSGMNRFSMSTFHLANGVYSFTVTSEGKFEEKGKLVILH